MFRLVLFILVTALGLSCTSDVTISMTNENPPSFKVKRNLSEVGTLPFFHVIEIAAENRSAAYSEQISDKNTTLWRIVPKDPATPIDRLPSITYGTVPSGFVQEIPKDGSPRKLIEGTLYEAGGPPVMMRRGIVRFEIRDGKAVSTTKVNGMAMRQKKILLNQPLIRLVRAHVLTVILALVLGSIVYWVFVIRARNQRIERYLRAYEGINVGDSRAAVVAAMGEPHEVTACAYTPFNDPKREAEFRAKCVQQYRYGLFMREYTISFDRNGAVINTSTAVSP